MPDSAGKGEANPPDEPSGEPRDEPSGELSVLRERVAALEAERKARVPRHRLRSACAALLIVLGCLLAPLGIVAAWTADEMGDTDRYVDTVAPLAADPAIQAAAADRATAAVMDQLDVKTLLDDLTQDVTPQDRPLVQKGLGKLGDTLEGTVRSFVHDRAQSVVASDAFEKIWTEANRRIHASMNKALTGSGGGAVKLEDDEVAVDLAPVVEELKQRLVDDGLTVAGRIPEVHTDFTVVRAEDIGKVKVYFRLLQLAGNWLPFVALLLLAGGVLLAVRRRRAVVAAALGAAAATLLLGIALTVFRPVYLDSLPAGVSQPAAEAVYDTLTHFLRTMVRMVVALGAAIALAAWLTGPGRRASAVRQLWYAGIGAVRTQADRLGLRTGPVGPFVYRYRRWIRWALVVAALLTYVLWSYPTGWVVVGLALALLFALALVDFTAEPQSVDFTAEPQSTEAAPTRD